MAAAWDLPVVFVLENNKYGVSTRIDDMTKVHDLSLRAAGYGMPGVRVDGFDLFAVHEAATVAVARARAGEGPTLLVTESYRVDGHYAGEPEVYRDKAEVAEYRAKDPIARFRTRVKEDGVLTADELDAVDAEVAAEMEEALAFAKAGVEPDPSTALDYIYA
jgi:pyruvate dehydrogenase E1 component alpha subunit